MKNLLIFCFCILVLNMGSAQDGHYTQYDQNPLYLNPALIGGEASSIRIGGIYRSQWQAVQSTYSNFGVFADTKIKNFALGLLINQNQAGETGYKKSNTLLSLGYRKPVGDGYNSLSLGAQIGMNQILIDPTNLTFDNQYVSGQGFDESLISGETNFSGTTKMTDINVGLAYHFDLDREVPVVGEVGLAIFHANAPQMTTLTGEVVTLSRKVVLHAKGFYHIRESFGVEPAAMVALQGTSREVLLGLNFGFNMSDTSGFKIGLGTRLKDAVLLTSQFKLGKLTLGLGFDYNISKLQQAPGFNNAMEISMIYNIPLKIEKGVRKDTDGDGISDRRDDCPEIPGLKRLNGCPEALDVKKEIPVLGQDYDKDGILDHNDLCPYEFGYAQFQGCNDQDADGIWDHIDVCPALPGKVENHGCPVEIPGIDSDNDGVPDRFDRCIYMKGLESLNGCPDTDGDGISDLLDNCPYLKGDRSNDGCPVDTKRNLGPETQKVRIENVEFFTNKDEIQSHYFSMLDDVAELLINEKYYKLMIEGHTDDEGNTTYNYNLSQRRGAAVRAYFIRKGVDPNKLEVLSFGENKPATANSSNYGKARNRRVELVLLNVNY